MTYSNEVKELVAIMIAWQSLHKKDSVNKLNNEACLHEDFFEDVAQAILQAGYTKNPTVIDESIIITNGKMSYELCKGRHGFWINGDGGEGGQFNEEEFFKLVDQFYAEYF